MALTNVEKRQRKLLLIGLAVARTKNRIDPLLWRPGEENNQSNSLANDGVNPAGATN